MASLTPPDIKQCQAEKPNGESFMTLGGGHRLVRCTEKPVFIATERDPGPDGQRGSMSLCADCRAQMEKQLGNDFADFEATKALRAKGGKHA